MTIFHLIYIIISDIFKYQPRFIHLEMINIIFFFINVYQKVIIIDIYFLR
jgi:hypothetical protein